MLTFFLLNALGSRKVGCCFLVLLALITEQIQAAIVIVHILLKGQTQKKKTDRL
jgi:hypothetical protein